MLLACHRVRLVNRGVPSVQIATMCFVTPGIYDTVTKQTFNSIDVESNRHDDWKMDRAERP